MLQTKIIRAMYYHFQQHPFRASAKTRKLVLLVMLFGMFFQGLMPQGYMPGSLSKGDSFLVICGSDLQVSLEEMLGLEPGALASSMDVHVDELCTFSGLASIDTASEQQLYQTFYLKRIESGTPSEFASFEITPNFFLPVKTGPPIA